MGARRELVSAVAERYRSAERTEKGRILLNNRLWTEMDKAVLDRRVERDLQRLVDGAVKKRIGEAKKDLLLWMMTHEVAQSRLISKGVQSKMREPFDGDTIDKLGGLPVSEASDVIYQKVKAARTELEALIPETFEVEFDLIQRRVTAELS